MTLNQVRAALELEIVHDEPDAEIRAAYTSDLLSDVMGNAVSDSILVTVQAHKNTIAVAALVGIRGIVICNNRSIPADMADASQAEGIALYRSSENQFTVSGKLYRMLAGESG